MTLTPTTEAPGPTDRSKRHGNDGRQLSVSFRGAEKGGAYGHLTGPVKIAQEVSAHGIAIELGAQCSRLHALLHGTLSTRATWALERFDELLGALVSGHPGITSSTWSRWDG